MRSTNKGKRMPTRRARLQRKVYNRIPSWFRHNDFEIFASMLCFTAGIPLLLGEIRTSSLESTLPYAVVMAWASILTFSPILVVTGLYRRGSRPVAESVFWIRIEALGLTSLAYSSYIYSVAILTNNPVMGWPASMLIIGFGLTCHTRELGLQVKIADFLLGLGVNEHR